ncbi:unnamed protein product [Rhodiola kirilowii]
MSWFGSIVNSLKLDGDENGAVSESSEQEPLHGGDDDDSSASQSEEGQPARGGVKEDLNEITKTLTRQFWGVASFLAPPPQESPIKESNFGGFESEVDRERSEEAAAAAGIYGIRSDFAEIGGRFKSGITKLSGGTKAVSELSKMATSILQFGLDQGSVGEYASGSAIGVTEEVVAFVMNIAMHPETWLDFPLADDDQEQDDFDMSDAQQEHALAVERLVPELAALRFELCPEYISEDFFWKIYFVLVHPRLDKHDADLISTPQILETRARLTQEMQNRRETEVESDISEGDTFCKKEYDASSHEISLSVPSDAQVETVPSHPSASKSAPTEALIPETERYTESVKDIQIVDKSVVKEGPKTVPQAQRSSPDLPSSSFNDNDEDDDWLKEETTEAGTGTGSGINIPITNDEDVSFSDLEEDDTDIPADTKKATYTSDSSTKSRDWVQLSRSSSDSAKENKLSDVKLAGSPNKESNDWLNVEDIDEI